MKNNNLLIVIAVLFMFLQGCMASGPDYYSDYGENLDYGQPSPILLNGSPYVIAVPDTYDVYVVPDVSVELFFWNGLWWRPWGGHWYSSHYYNRGWTYYRSGTPSFYRKVDPHWRAYYTSRNWRGYRWNYERIPSNQAQRNWKTWQNDKYWEKHGTWGIQNYQPRTKQQRQGLREEKARQSLWAQPQVQQQQQHQVQPQRLSQVQKQPRTVQPRQQAQRQVKLEQPKSQYPVKQAPRLAKVEKPKRQHQAQQPQRQPQIQRPQQGERQAQKTQRQDQIQQPQRQVREQFRWLQPGQQAPKQAKLEQPRRQQQEKTKRRWDVEQRDGGRGQNLTEKFSQ